ncbi:FAD-binding domain-containing protein [Salinarimonas soli]|uniref:DNA photolyase FAD-binding protein n=1 Tax=Salinarimonas soli TaxID=1638099 RepID=A0A5B2V932_9HYPH|nr:FAD-binding domain-containing protein [Salinarimonas soli]KAA2235524.1 DNA photolyase FAD-binding protein [Salinarimonas soli]
MTDRLFPPTRAQGLQRLHAFVPRAGRLYAETRQEDRGPGLRRNVSMLSPYLRHRLVDEREVLAAVLARHDPDACTRFVQEVLWRTYWKGWLEMRPGIWTRYRAEADAAHARLDAEPDLRARYEAAVAGRTGIDCFDAWAGELRETGYLHNFARMWFASIWIFTLRLPWALGADHFLHHLVDADPATNTLSWRWVGGLQTRGKTYLATAEAIARATGGRFSPQGLARSAPPLMEEPPPPARPLPRVPPPPEGAVALLLTPEDLGPEAWPLGSCEVRAVGAVDAGDARPGRSGPAGAFVSGALADGLSRAGAAHGVPSQALAGLEVEALCRFARAAGVHTLVTGYAPVGPVAERLAALEPELRARGIALVPQRRAFDGRFWPRALAGYFTFREAIPELLEAEGLLPPAETDLFGQAPPQRGVPKRAAHRDQA